MKHRMSKRLFCEDWVPAGRMSRDPESRHCKSLWGFTQGDDTSDKTGYPIRNASKAVLGRESQTLPMAHPHHRGQRGTREAMSQGGRPQSGGETPEKISLEERSVHDSQVLRYRNFEQARSIWSICLHLLLNMEWE